MVEEAGPKGDSYFSATQGWLLADTQGVKEAGAWDSPQI